MVAIRKCFAMVLALGAAMAAPLATDASSNLVALEARPNHNPAVANIYRGTNNRAVVVTMAFTHIPTSLTQQGFAVMRDLIQNKFLTWVYSQDPLLRDFWQGIVAGEGGNFAYSVARDSNNVVQYQLAVELAAANYNLVTGFLIRPLAAYLANAGVQVNQVAGTISSELEQAMAAQGEKIKASNGTLDARDGAAAASTCAAEPNINPYIYANNNPPSPFNVNLVRWCH